ncbi:IS607 family transposase [Lactobacillus iners]|uniref:IS607 family transposase n=1 Tax=Lactobacillus iners TaxID=147802 RepID=UPI0001E99DAE|nr:IS607 family transposase [Lactobacillus iners]EFQ47682.1 resolvase, N-terminal domain protein [Lactobacillus iners LEAF 2053A-b]MCT7825365.1 IS607 family transposase [Lactobacillus iners]
MKAGKVMNLLQISRSTLKRYREKGILKASRLPSGQYIFDDDSVLLLKNGRSPRLTLLYGRISTYKQKHDLANQMQELQNFAEKKGYQVDGSYQDIASGISFKNRKQFLKMLDLIIEGKVERVVITHQDRLSRVGFELFEYLFRNYNTEIEVISDELNPKTDEQELFEEIISLLHCFSMRDDSHRRKECELIEQSLNKK